MAPVAAKVGLSFSFSGSGFLGMYHLGVVARLKEGQTTNQDPFYIKSALGASAGALAAATLIFDLPLSARKQVVLNLTSQVKSLGVLGPFHSDFDIVDLLQEDLIQTLPFDAHIRATDKLHVSMTDSKMNNVIVSKYASLDELKDAIICSCYVPAFSSWKQAPKYNGKYYFDGGFSNKQPVLDEETTIRISPFAGGSHICPNDEIEESADGGGASLSKKKPYTAILGGEELHLTSTNMKRIWEAMKKPPEDMNAIFNQGYEQTDKFLLSPKFKQFLNDIPSVQQHEDPKEYNVAS